MTLRARLALGLLTIVFILVVPLLFAVASLEQLHRDARGLREGEFAASLLLGRMREGLNELRRVETALLFVHDAATRDAMARDVDRLSLLSDSLDHYHLAQAAEGLRAVVREIANWAPLEYQAALAGRLDTAEAVSQRHLVPAIARADASVLVAEGQLRERTALRVDRANAAIARAERIASMALVLALALAIAIAMWLMRTISRPVSHLERGMQAIVDGDLTWRLPELTSRRDEFGTLAKRFEDMTRQLEELDKLKAEFVSVASHELKTPINVVLGYVQLLEEGVFGPVAPQQREVLQTVTTQTQALARLVQRLLDVSRFEAGGAKLEPRPLSLEKFLDQLEHAFAVLATQRGIRFVVRRGEGLPAQVVWDHDRISEVLGNLLSNAFKFTNRGGDVELSVDAVADGSGVQMEVRDTGAGIPPDQLPHVFEKFYQASNQPRRGAGSGLGLAIAKEIVEAHRGSIACESTPGVGTMFTIVLPERVAQRRSSMQRMEPVNA